MKKKLKILDAIFYRTEAGNEPVREWLLDSSKADRKIIGDDVRTVQYGYPVGMPLVKPMGQGLYELRSQLSGGRISRVFFCVKEDTMIMLHGFIKKTQKTPHSDLELARKRQRNLKG